MTGKEGGDTMQCDALVSGREGDQLVDQVTQVREKNSWGC